MEFVALFVNVTSNHDFGLINVFMSLTSLGSFVWPHNPISLTGCQLWEIICPCCGLSNMCHIWDDFHQILSNMWVVLKPTYITKRKNNIKTFDDLQWLSLVVDKTEQMLQLQKLSASDKSLVGYQLSYLYNTYLTWSIFCL